MLHLLGHIVYTARGERVSYPEISDDTSIAERPATPRDLADGGPQLVVLSSGRCVPLSPAEVAILRARHG